MNSEESKKYNFRIEIKNEKEIKQFIVLLLLTAVLSFSLFEWRDLTENMLLYKVSATLFPVLVAVPSVVFFCIRKAKIIDLFKGDIKKQIFIGLGIAVMQATIVLFVLLAVRREELSIVYVMNFSGFIYVLVHFLLTIGVTEEFIYRVELQERLEFIFGKYKIAAPLVAAVLFGFVHIISGTWMQVVLSIVFGCVLGYAKMFIKSCTFLSVVIAHGVYDLLLYFVPTIIVNYL